MLKVIQSSVLEALLLPCILMYYKFVAANRREAAHYSCCGNSCPDLHGVMHSSLSISYPEPAIFRRRIESSGIIHNRKPEILAFLLDCYIPFCINNQSDSPRFMDYPRALDSSPEDRGLGVLD